MKKLVISIIAIALIAAVVGTCFALYYQKVEKEVSIDAGNQIVNMYISAAEGFNPASLSKIENVTFAQKFNPNNVEQSIDVVLAINNSELADGAKGNFTVALEDSLASSLTLQVLKVPAEGEPTNITAAATGAGEMIALSATPQTIRIIATLNEVGDFMDIAEQTATLTLNWTYVEFEYDADTYYAVGIINGVSDGYAPYASSVALTDALTDSNHAQKMNVTLKPGDEFVLVKNYKADDPAQRVYAYAQDGNSSVDGVSVVDDGYGHKKIQMTENAANHTYDIYLNGENKIWVDIHVD